MSVVFVGNIPYDYTEEQLTDIFKQVGPVKNFRLVFDKDNGRGKGYGFCEYTDAGNAQSAVRNLDGYDVGNRQLRVAFSDSDQNKVKNATAIGTALPPASLQQLPPPPPPPPSSVPPAFAQQFAAGRASSQPPAMPNSAVPPLPAGTQPPANITATDAISRTLSAMPPMQLLDVIAHFKSLVQTNPGQAETLLKQAPPLAYAVLQALLLMNLVDAQVLTKVISTGSVAAPSQQQQQQQPPQQVPQQALQPALQPTTFRNSPTPVPQTQQQQYRQSPIPQAPAPTPVPVAAAAARQPTPQRDPNTTALINQVMALTDVQINALPLEQKNQILMIKQQVSAGLM